jgi:hypothetical protein
MIWLVLIMPFGMVILKCLISYDKSKVSMDAINKKAAAVGHDTDAVK